MSVLQEKTYEAIVTGCNTAVLNENVVYGFANSGLWQLTPNVLCEQGTQLCGGEDQKLTCNQFHLDLHCTFPEYRRNGFPKLGVGEGLIYTK